MSVKPGTSRRKTWGKPRKTRKTGKTWGKLGNLGNTGKIWGKSGKLGENLRKIRMVVSSVCMYFVV